MSDPDVAIVEQRTYTLGTGRLPAYLKLYGEEGYPVQLRILEHCLGYFSVDIGPLNTVVHQWAFASHEDRDARRARMAADPRWQAYWARASQLVTAQQCVILRPAPFFRARLVTMLGAAPAQSDGDA